MEQEKNIVNDEFCYILSEDNIAYVELTKKYMPEDVKVDLAEITKDYPLIYNLVKKDCDEWWSREDIVKTVFPPILISGVD